MKAVIGVGTNVGDRLQNIRDAKKRLGLFPKQKLRRFLLFTKLNLGDMTNRIIFELCYDC